MDVSEHVEIDDARRIVLEAVRPLATVTLELDAALGRVLAEEVVTEWGLPTFDSSAMDGFAVWAADITTAGAEGPVALRVVDESRAGRPARVALQHGQAITVSTGAIVPAGADAVVPLEHTLRENGLVHVLECPQSGAYVRRAGEDMASGARVLARGTILGPAQLGMLAALRRDRVSCTHAPRVSVLVTGDELLAPGEESRPGAIGNSNSHTIAALARCAGARVLRSTVVPDDADSTRAAIAQSVEDSDAVLVCGGMSVGEHDHVRSSLRALGARQAFWGLALRPGHPTWFGRLDQTPVFGLPGNPVSAMVTFVLLAGPALRAMQGCARAAERPTALLDGGYDKPAGRAYALRCRVSAYDDGLHAQLTGPQGSHILSSMLAADALAILPSSATHVAPGTRVEIEPLQPWMVAFT
jgi:molybdopterin molybdotransferase